MKILKDRSNYLENKIDSGNNKSSILTILLILGCAGVFSGVIINNILLIILSIVLMQIGWVIYKQSCKDVNACRKGIIGEQTVIDALKNLDDKFYLINDITLQQPYGNIDHILLGPNGIFVIETKNYKGNIECHGDDWHRYYENRGGNRDYSIASPSKQVKRNAVGLKNFLNKNADILKNKPNLFINSIIVFTDPNINLNLENPTVPIKRPEELYNYIKSFKSNILFTKDDLDSIAKVIIDASR